MEEVRKIINLELEGDTMMNKAYALNKGDKVAIVSLSGGLLGEPFCAHDIVLGEKRLNEFGLEMVIMPNALKGISFLREHPESRAEDLKMAFADPEIKAIICAIGGDDTYKLLPYLLDDKEFVENVQKHPKIFTGFSDSTVNHLMFYKLGLSTYYGPNLINDLAELADNMLPYTKDAFRRYLSGSHTDIVSASEYWYEERTDFSPASIGTERKTHLETRGYELLQGEAVFSGELLGGCIDTLYDILVGDPTPDAKSVCDKYAIFPDRNEWTGKIMFIETSENCMTPERLEEFLTVIKDRGILDVISGIIVGKPQNEVFYDEYKALYKSFLADYSKLSVVYNMNFGHAYPRMVLPYGMPVKIDMTKKEIQYLTPIVK